ncbi:DEAD/DEAH box helicase [uncultured Maritimibacter sp.]|jgi:ATP-dependent RNA helicase RhlE|uniref:DEAD/DEAH box helicase n=1 Tax=uncultured Maritimibacter sp. TaxID=991866 RepID=UPI000AB8F24B|nr:DEAD/DEAH box helicase [uncultured Maritimibacter sp.]
MTKFSDLGLDPKLLAAIEGAGYDTPSPIQAQAIPLVLSGRDVMGLAQTGTGKTAAFGLPLIHTLMQQPGKPMPKNVRALILAPTRELVGQIADNLKIYAKGTKLFVGTVVGGLSINKQAQMLTKGVDILVATPGRLIDLMDRGAVRLDQATFLVLDEADQMLDMGFIHALRQIAPKLGTPRQTMLFSATMPKLMEELSRSYLTNPAKVQVATPGKAADKITQGVHWAQSKGEKVELLIKYLSKEPDALSLVFGRTKHGSEKLKRQLEDAGFKAVSIHGNKSQGQRDRALQAFRDGAARVLVATDVAARGIDIPGVSHVYNFDLPEVPENYVHRIGRTARAGADGDAIAFVTGDEIGLLKQIQKVMKVDIPVIGGERPEEVEPEKKQRGGRGGPRGGGRGASGGGNGGQRQHKPKSASQGKPANGGQQKRNRNRRSGGGGKARAA